MAGSIIAALMVSQFQATLNISQAITVIRVFRVLRVFRLIKKARMMNNIFNSFLNTIPTFTNVLILIGLCIYLFAAIGNKIFAEVKISGNMSEHINFKTFSNSIQTLIMIMTGEGWYNIVTDLSK